MTGATDERAAKPRSVATAIGIVVGKERLNSADFFSENNGDGISRRR
jgi:hypothetical protein